MSLNTLQTTSALVANILRPGVNSIVLYTKTTTAKRDQIFQTFKSDKNYEIDWELKGTGYARIKPEGSPIAMDNIYQVYSQIYNPITVSLGFEITKEAWSDSQLYKAQFPQQAKVLALSHEATQEVFAASILNKAFDPAAPLGDGLPLCATDIPLPGGGSYSNTFPSGTPVALSSTGVQQAIVLINKFKAASGLLTGTLPEQLIVPPELQFRAIEIKESKYIPENANNAVSAINQGGFLPKPTIVWQYLTASPTAWFIKTNQPDGFKHISRWGLEENVWTDPSTLSIMFRYTRRDAYGVTDRRCVAGSRGA